MENFRGWTRLEVAVYWLRRLCRFVASLVPRVARSRLAAGTSLFLASVRLAVGVDRPLLGRKRLGAELTSFPTGFTPSVPLRREPAERAKPRRVGSASEASIPNLIAAGVRHDPEFT